MFVQQNTSFVWVECLDYSSFYNNNKTNKNRFMYRYSFHLPSQCDGNGKKPITLGKTARLKIKSINREWYTIAWK